MLGIRYMLSVIQRPIDMSFLQPPFPYQYLTGWTLILFLGGSLVVEYCAVAYLCAPRWVE